MAERDWSRLAEREWSHLAERRRSRLAERQRSRLAEPRVVFIGRSTTARDADTAADMLHVGPARAHALGPIVRWHSPASDSRSADFSDSTLATTVQPPDLRPADYSDSTRSPTRLPQSLIGGRSCALITKRRKFAESVDDFRRQFHHRDTLLSVRRGTIPQPINEHGLRHIAAILQNRTYSLVPPLLGTRSLCVRHRVAPARLGRNIAR